MTQHGDGRWGDERIGFVVACGRGCWEPTRLPQDGTGGWHVLQQAYWAAGGPGWWADTGDGAWSQGYRRV